MEKVLLSMEESMMKNKNRWISICLVVILVFNFSVSVMASAGYDKTPPVINYIKICNPDVSSYQAHDISMYHLVSRN